MIDSYCETGSGRCLCSAGFMAGQILNASCVRLSETTCRVNIDCTDAIPGSHCDSSRGLCQCDILMSDDGTGNTCILRPIGGFCRDITDCTDVVPVSQCGADNRCECISGFYALDDDSSSPQCVRRRVGSNCNMTSHCSDAFTGSDCVHGACVCRREYKVTGNGTSCERRRLDSADDARCATDSEDCDAMFDNSVCGHDHVCECLPGYRPDQLQFTCIPRRHLSDQSPCRNDIDCSQAIHNSRCQPLNSTCACLTGYRPDNTASGGNTSDICRRRTVGDQCAKDIDCSAIMSATCDPAGVCACVAGYGIPLMGGVDCERRLIGGAVGCKDDLECLETIEFSKCRQSSCHCVVGYMSVDNGSSCVPRKISHHATLSNRVLSIGYNTVWSELCEYNEQTHSRQCDNLFIS